MLLLSRILKIAAVVFWGFGILGFGASLAVFHPETRSSFSETLALETLVICIIVGLLLFGLGRRLANR